MKYIVYINLLINDNDKQTIKIEVQPYDKIKGIVLKRLHSVDFDNLVYTLSVSVINRITGWHIFALNTRSKLLKNCSDIEKILKSLIIDALNAKILKISGKLNSIAKLGEIH